MKKLLLVTYIHGSIVEKAHSLLTALNKDGKMEVTIIKPCKIFNEIHERIQTPISFCNIVCRILNESTLMSS